ncbi:hypothetical protein OIU76_005005 [Salix suchowensis]|nr:hypothetical protein OIU76_005005 [Salix suchowensis]
MGAVTAVLSGWKTKVLHVIQLIKFIEGLWIRFHKLGATADPLSSFEYGTILCMLREGINLSLTLLH